MKRKRGEKIVGFHMDGQRWRVVDKSDYEKKFTADIATQYLWNEIHESIEREMNHILSGKKTGYYAGLRFLFAELTYLSHLYWGKRACKPPNESKYVVKFMRRFKILAPEYGVHYDVFRHGLIHTHHPKWLKKNNKVIPWSVSSERKMTDFGVSLPEFTFQLKQTIRKFRALLLTDGPRKTRLNKFFEGYYEAARLISRNELKSYARKDFSKVQPPS